MSRKNLASHIFVHVFLKIGCVKIVSALKMNVYAPPEFWQPPKRPHGITTETTNVCIFTAAGASNLTMSYKTNTPFVICILNSSHCSFTEMMAFWHADNAKSKRCINKLGTCFSKDTVSSVFICANWFPREQANTKPDQQCGKHLISVFPQLEFSIQFEYTEY
jgi:hypothetical protein